MDITEEILRKAGLENYPYLMNGEAPFKTLSKIAILTALILLTIGIGFLARWLFVNYLLKIGDTILHQIPFVNRIYKASKDIVHSVFASKSAPFSQVVFVPFPNDQTLSIGLITQTHIPIQSSTDPIPSMVSVFVPGTPNPAMGFMLMFKKEQLIFVDIKVEDAMKFVVSCGVIMPDFNMIAPPDFRIETQNENTQTP